MAQVGEKNFLKHSFFRHCFILKSVPARIFFAIVCQQETGPPPGGIFALGALRFEACMGMEGLPSHINVNLLCECRVNDYGVAKSISNDRVHVLVDCSMYVRVLPSGTDT